MAALGEPALLTVEQAFVAKERWDDANEGYLPGAQELVIEILSPSNTKAQIREYAALCLANGCEEFWVIDHSQNTVTCKNGQSIQYSQGMEVPLPLLSGTSIAVDLIFG